MKDLELLLKSIKNKELLPIYFLQGDEPFFIDTLVKALESDVLTEEERDFGQTVLYGKDTSLEEVMALAQQFPMFGDRNLIIVKEAQDLGYKSDSKGVAMLLNYLENPQPTTVLVFAHKYKKLDGKTKLAKELQKKQYLFLSEKMRDYQVPKWIADECKRLSIKTSPNISFLLAEYLGTDLSRISNELSKLKMLMKDGEILDEKMVEKHIGISKEFNVFELQKALGQKDVNKSMRIAFFLGKNPKNNPFVLIIGNLYNFFSNIIIYHTMRGQSPNEIATAMGVNPYFLKDYEEAARYYPLKLSTRIISILREFDLKSKGYGVGKVDEMELLKELTYKILNVDKIKVKL